MSQTDYKKMSDSEKKKEDWMNSKWRPMMGWSYMLTCIADFVIFPVLWSILQSISKGQVNIQWQPITLQGAGLYHIAMGAVLGIAAYGRTQEKMSGANNGGINLPSNVGTTYTPPAAIQQPAAGGFGQSVANSPGGSNFGSAPSSASFGQSAPTWSPAPMGSNDVITGFGGKKAPPPVTDFPER